MRTPRQHVAETASLMDRLPKNDSDIMRAQRHVENPRHRALADELRPLLDWRRLSNPNSGTWASPANDNVSLTHEGVTPSVNAELEQRPSPEELERAWKEGGPDAALQLRQKDSFGTPKGAAQDKDKYREKAIAALKYVLAYVQGEPIEVANLPDEHWRHIPTPHEENAKKIAARALLAEFGVGRDVPFQEARARAWRSAVANDNVPAFPWRPSDPREIFYTGRMRGNPTATRGGEFNDGVTSAETQRLEFAHLRGRLSRDAVKVLDIAVEAENFTEVGEAFGFEGKTAERRGKSLVLKACAELKAALAKHEV